MWKLIPNTKIAWYSTTVYSDISRSKQRIRKEQFCWRYLGTLQTAIQYCSINIIKRKEMDGYCEFLSWLAVYARNKSAYWLWDEVAGRKKNRLNEVWQFFSFQTIKHPFEKNSYKVLVKRNRITSCFPLLSVCNKFTWLEDILCVFHMFHSTVYTNIYNIGFLSYY